MNPLLQAHSANNTNNKNLNPLLRKELAKIKLSFNEKLSKAHLQLEILKLQMSLSALFDFHAPPFSIKVKDKLNNP